MRSCLLVVMALLPAAPRAVAAPAVPAVHRIDSTALTGDVDVVLWTRVLGVLPKRPRQIHVLDLDRLTETTRRTLQGIDGFVLKGQTTIVVVRQGETFKRAVSGSPLDQLVLASLIWHEMAHAEGFDEAAAFAREQALWRGFAAEGRVATDVALTYVARLADASGAGAADRADGRVARLK